ncbi:MAG: peptidylprolyl isomerase [Vulcanimicrobiaceae bacterium]
MPNAIRVTLGCAAAVLGLALAACSSATAGGGGDVASVNGTSISRADFDSRLEAGPQGKSVLNQLIQGLLIDQYAKDNHIDIPASDVQKKEDEIKSKYPPGQFEAILKAQNLTEADVQRILRQQLVIQKAVSGTVHVSDADVAKYLQANHATLDRGEQVRARHILVADQKTAEALEAQLKAGAKFEDLAKKYSTDPSSKDKGGELGYFSKGQMVPAFEHAAFTQPLNVVGQPVKSPFGYHVIEVEERKPAQVATVANSGDKIRQLLTQQQEQQQIPEFLAGLRQKANIQIYDTNLKDALPPVPATAVPAAPAPAASK